jgi:hypothetical protein
VVAGGVVGEYYIMIMKVLRIRGLSTDLDHALQRFASLRLHLGSNALKGRDRRARSVHRWYSEALAHLGLDEKGRTLVSSIGVFLENGSMVLGGILTAFLHHGY